jgi:hypothetical protein
MPENYPILCNNSCMNIDPKTVSLSKAIFKEIHIFDYPDSAALRQIERDYQNLKYYPIP